MAAILADAEVAEPIVIDVPALKASDVVVDTPPVVPVTVMAPLAPLRVLAVNFTVGPSWAELAAVTEIEPPLALKLLEPVRLIEPAVLVALMLKPKPFAVRLLFAPTVIPRLPELDIYN